MKNLYDILEIPSTSSQEEIKRAFRRQAIKYHPDKNFGDKYFAQKFIEVREAYEVLSNKDKKEEYDLAYKLFYSKQTQGQKETIKQKASEEKRQRKEKEEKFYYEPTKPFYSSRDRQTQETPQFNPTFDLFGEKLDSELDFFTLPKKIGKIIGAFSDLHKEGRPLTQKEKNISLAKGFGIGLAIGTAIFFLASLSNPIWIGIWFIVPTAGIMWLANAGNQFLHTNLFVGVNGFAEYQCEDSRKNIKIQDEVNFSEITDLYIYRIEKKVNFNYQGTDFLYVWLNCETGKVAYVKEGTFDKKSEIKNQGTEVNFQRVCENYWTVYLLDKLEENLQKNGHILFNLYSHEENSYQNYIKLGIGQITFIKGENEEFTYKFNDIKKLYTKGGNLHIQHQNFEKKFYFFKSGNEDVIPLLNLCNRQFFFKAIELLLGYKFS